MPPRSLPYRTLLAFVLACAAGCVPSVSWLPDSSGFVYCDGERFERLVRYDLKDGLPKVLVEDTQTATFWPAVSPDGKQVALARFTGEKGKPYLMQVRLYGLDGKELHRSPDFEWKPDDGKADDTQTRPTRLFWSPKGDKVLVTDYIEDRGRTGVYDPATKKAVLLDGFPAAFAGTPVRPDGKGFLLAQGENDALELFFVDWQGNKQAVALKPGAAADNDKRNALVWASFYTSRWDGNRALVTRGGSRITVDTAKLAAAHEAVEPESVEGKPVEQQYAFAAGARLRVLTVEEPDPEDANKKIEFHLLEVVKKGVKGPGAVVAKSKAPYLLAPSPDGKMVAMRYVAAGTDTQKLLVVNGAGEVVADLETVSSK